MAASTAIIHGDMDFFRAATDGGRTWTVVGRAVVAKGQKKKYSYLMPLPVVAVSRFKPGYSLGNFFLNRLW